MKLNRYNTSKITIYILINIFILFINNIIYANHQKIEIYSKFQSINKSSNIINFKDNVICKYKNIQLHADTITITHNQNKHNLSILKAYGNPAMIKYIQKTNCIMASAHAESIYYDAINNTITLVGNAHIEYLGNSIHSDSIIYTINQKKIQAISNQNSKTTAILSINPT